MLYSIEANQLSLYFLPFTFYVLNFCAYSSLNVFTGLLLAAFMACVLTVKKATNKAEIPASAKTHHCISIR